LIAGGDAKGADFSELTSVIKQHCRAVVLIGKDAARIASVVPEEIIIEQAVDMQSAVLAAQAFSQPGDSVLLAPACASFDMFNGFEHRGDVFVTAVEELLAEVSMS
jgi:UDP-N-acetylmuramoylalanine--D-glutamate ligase